MTSVQYWGEGKNTVLVQHCRLLMRKPNIRTVRLHKNSFFKEQKWLLVLLSRVYCGVFFLQLYRSRIFTIFFCFTRHSLPQIYEEFYHTVNNADHEKDLRWWSNTHGVNMSMNWPQFEVKMRFFFTIPRFSLLFPGKVGARNEG